MGFNYAIEKNRFMNEWNKKRKMMIEAGMSESNIQEMLVFDWEWFKSIRKYEHWKTTEQIALEEIEDTLTEEMYFDLIDQLEDRRLIKGLGSLKEKELELLIKIVVEEYQQVEIAKAQGIDKSIIHRKFDALKAKIRRMVQA